MLHRSLPAVTQVVNSRRVQSTTRGRLASVPSVLFWYADVEIGKEKEKRKQKTSSAFLLVASSNLEDILAQYTCVNGKQP